MVLSVLVSPPHLKALSNDIPLVVYDMDDMRQTCCG